MLYYTGKPTQVGYEEDGEKSLEIRSRFLKFSLINAIATTLGISDDDRKQRTFTNTNSKEVGPQPKETVHGPRESLVTIIKWLDDYDENVEPRKNNKGVVSVPSTHLGDTIKIAVAWAAKSESENTLMKKVFKETLGDALNWIKCLGISYEDDIVKRNLSESLLNATEWASGSCSHDEKMKNTLADYVNIINDWVKPSENEESIETDANDFSKKDIEEYENEQSQIEKELDRGPYEKDIDYVTGNNRLSIPEKFDLGDKDTEHKMENESKTSQLIKVSEEATAKPLVTSQKIYTSEKNLVFEGKDNLDNEEITHTNTVDSCNSESELDDELGTKIDRDWKERQNLRNSLVGLATTIKNVKTNKEAEVIQNELVDIIGIAIKLATNITSKNEEEVLRQQLVQTLLLSVDWLANSAVNEDEDIRNQIIESLIFTVDWANCSEGKGEKAIIKQLLRHTLTTSLKGGSIRSKSKKFGLKIKKKNNNERDGIMDQISEANENQSKDAQTAYVKQTLFEVGSNETSFQVGMYESKIVGDEKSECTHENEENSLCTHVDEGNNSIENKQSKSDIRNIGVNQREEREEALEKNNVAENKQVEYNGYTSTDNFAPMEVLVIDDEAKDMSAYEKALVTQASNKEEPNTSINSPLNELSDVTDQQISKEIRKIERYLSDFANTIKDIQPQKEGKLIQNELLDIFDIAILMAKDITSKNEAEKLKLQLAQSLVFSVNWLMTAHVAEDEDVKKRLIQLHMLAINWATNKVGPGENLGTGQLRRQKFVTAIEDNNNKYLSGDRKDKNEISAVETLTDNKTDIHGLSPKLTKSTKEDLVIDEAHEHSVKSTNSSIEDETNPLHDLKCSLKEIYNWVNSIKPKSYEKLIKRELLEDLETAMRLASQRNLTKSEDNVLKNLIRETLMVALDWAMSVDDEDGENMKSQTIDSLVYAINWASTSYTKDKDAEMTQLLRRSLESAKNWRKNT